MGIIIWLVWIGTSIWVGFDSAKLMKDIPKEERKRIVGAIGATSPAAWVIGCLLLWIVLFPLYLIKRPQYLSFSQPQYRPSGPRQCPSCRKFYEGDPSFCPNCGGKLKSEISKITEEVSWGAKSSQTNLLDKQYKVVIIKIGEGVTRLRVAKALAGRKSISLSEALDLIDSAPCAVYEGPKTEACSLANELRQAGASINVDETVEDEKDVTCPKCGETNPKYYRTCWKCNTPLSMSPTSTSSSRIIEAPKPSDRKGDTERREKKLKVAFLVIGLMLICLFVLWTTTSVLDGIFRGCSSKPPPYRPRHRPRPYFEQELSEEVTISCSDDGLVINGTKMDMPYLREALSEAIGKPTRSVKKLANDIDVWDNLGVHAYTKPGDFKYHTIGVAVKEATSDFDPKSVFKGVLAINGNKFIWESGEKELISHGFRQDADPLFSWVYEKEFGHIKLIAWMSESGRRIDRLEISLK